MFGACLLPHMPFYKLVGEGGRYWRSKTSASHYCIFKMRVFSYIPLFFFFFCNYNISHEFFFSSLKSCENNLYWEVLHYFWCWHITFHRSNQFLRSLNSDLSLGNGRTINKIIQSLLRLVQQSPTWKGLAATTFHVITHFLSGQREVTHLPSRKIIWSLSPHVFIA